MKKTFTAVCRALLPLVAVVALAAGCVESEQSPFGGGDGGGGAYVDAMLPAYGEFYVGSQVTLRGSGFTSGDRVVVRNGYEHDADVTEVEAEVVACSDSELTFVIPSGVVATEVTVYLVRDGVRHRLGVLAVMRTDMQWGYIGVIDGMPTVEFYGSGLSNGVRVLFQCLHTDEYGNRTPVGEVRDAQVGSLDDSRLTAGVPVIGDALIIFERGGLQSVVGEVHVDVRDVVEMPEIPQGFGPGSELTIRSKCFNHDDRIIVRCSDGSGAEVIDAPKGNDCLTFTMPALGDAGCDFDIILEHSWMEYYLFTIPSGMMDWEE